MLFVFGLILSLLLVLWAAGHLLFAFYFANTIVARPLRNSAQDSTNFTPPASIVIALRGYDPSLRKNIAGLLSQNYENYEVVIVIDSRQDAAWKVVEELKAEFDTDNRLRYMALEAPVDTCSLKCNSLIQAYSTLDPASEILALIDADVVPHENWLRDVVTPLEDLTIGVSTGNQWYSPPDDSIGSLLRSVWNSGAIVPTATFANPWAGTCAMRTADIERTGLVDIWKNSAVDDGPIREAMNPIGLNVHFEPRLIMINRDSCTSRYVGQYVTRMLTWSRMYESTFVNTVVHMSITVLLLAACCFTFLLCLLIGDFLAATTVASGILIWNLLMLSSFCMVRSGICRAIRSRQAKLEPLTVQRMFRIFLLLPICQIAHGFWTLSAMLSKRVDWRNVTYRLKGQNEIEMVKYQPYSSDSEQTPSRVSI